MGMDLHGYRDRGLTVWKLEYEWSQFYNSGRSLGLKTGGDDDVTPSMRLKTWEPGGHSCKSWSLKSQEPKLLCSWSRRERGREECLVHSGPQDIGWCPPTLVRTDLFTQSMDSNANLFQKHHLRNTQNQCYIKLTITETINKGNPNKGSLLRIQGLVLLAQGMEWILS